MKKRFRLTVIELWIVLILLGSIILTFWPQMQAVKAARDREECAANIISIIMAIRLYEAKEGAEYSAPTAKQLLKAGYLSEELYCPVTNEYYRIDAELDMAICPSGMPGHSWPAEE